MGILKGAPSPVGLALGLEAARQASFRDLQEQSGQLDHVLAQPGAPNGDPPGGIDVAGVDVLDDCLRRRLLWCGRPQALVANL